MSEVSNIRPLRRPDGSRPVLREVMRNDANGLPRPDRADEGIRERTVEFIRLVWPENAVKHLATALGRKSSLSGARAIIEGRQTITMSDALRLSRHPGFGRRFILYVFDYPESPDYTEVLDGIAKLREKLAEI